MDTNKIKQNIAPGFWGAVAGAVVLAIVGFNWGGWVTSSTAKELADAAVTDRLVPICVDQFNHDTDKTAKLAELKKEEFWKRADFVARQGWATMPGAQEADASIAEDCATRISS